MNNFLLVLNEGYMSKKVTKIIFYIDGGFCVLAPYHNAKSGFLAKMILDYTVMGEQLVNRDSSFEYSADDRVKLSFHPSGFIQFSGTNPNIISGMNENGEPKGLGIIIEPLKRVIKSGPTFGINLWGLNDFETFSNRKSREQVIEINESDYYYRDCTQEDWNGYLIEGFLFEAKLKRYIVKDRYRDRDILPIIHNNYIIPKKVFTHRIIPYYKEDYFIGLLVSRTKFHFKSPSGYTLSSPSQIIDKNRAYSLFCQYPTEPDIVLPTQSLNYVPKNI